MGAIKSQIGSKASYSNIHNVLNPIDPVPKVAPTNPRRGILQDTALTRP
jgi:hypothetical protein